MKQILYLFVLLGSYVFINACATSLVSKGNLDQLKEETKDVVYTAKRSIYSGFGSSLKKEAKNSQNFIKTTGASF